VKPISQFSILPTTSPSFRRQLALFGCAILLFTPSRMFLFGGPQESEGLVCRRGGGGKSPPHGSRKAANAPGPDGLISGFGGSVTVDGFRHFFNWIFRSIAAVDVAGGPYQYLRNSRGEHSTGILQPGRSFAQSGMYFCHGTDLVRSHRPLELMALCFYVMVGFPAHR